ncbi:MAG: YdcH family protein [Gammaproteobacteria bacterium]
MFEYDQPIVQALLANSEQFRDLYKEHHDLKEKVRNAELGILPVDDFALGTMKKQKLLAKDKMARMIEQYRKERESSPGTQAEL